MGRGTEEASGGRRSLPRASWSQPSSDLGGINRFIADDFELVEIDWTTTAPAARGVVRIKREPGTVRS